MTNLVRLWKSDSVSLDSEKVANQTSPKLLTVFNMVDRDDSSKPGGGSQGDRVPGSHLYVKVDRNGGVGITSSCSVVNEEGIRGALFWN